MGVRQLFCFIILLEVTVTTITLCNLEPITEAVMELYSRLIVPWRRAEIEESPTVPELVEDCMKTANFRSQTLIESARANVDYFYTEFRKAIPESPLTGYRSHCWVGNYTVVWNRPNKYDCHGELGNATFARNLEAFYPYPDHIFPFMEENYPKGEYTTSSIVCLPNVFVMGFPKCGSTFLYHIVDGLISLSSNNWHKNQVAKETQFWVHFDPFRKNAVSVPQVGDLGRYLFNFIPGLEKISSNETSTMLMDGTPTYIYQWPIFTEEESNVTNYCLIPSTLPRLLPDSRYFVIMRNPISMLYSNFWFSCTKSVIPLPFPQMGPDIFHQRTVSKVAKFNRCMKDASVESINFTCTMLDAEQYASCIKKRLHLLDKCTVDALPEIYSPEMPLCGEVRLSMGLFYVHVRKWLNIVPKKRFKFLTLEEVDMNPSLAAHDILEFLDLNATLADDVSNVNKVMMSGQTNTQHMIDYKKDKRLQIRTATKNLLEIFYHPFNSLLAELLGDNKYKWF